MVHINDQLSNRSKWEMLWPRALLLLIPVVAAVVILAVMIGPGEAYAQCDTDAVQQTWLNVNPDTRSIRRLDIFFPCNDLQAIGVGGKPQPTPSIEFAATVKLYGACHPADCDWGNIDLYKRSGNSDTNGEFFGKNNSGFATRQISLHFEQDRGIVLTINTHFTDHSGRADYTSIDYFFPAKNLNLVAKHSGKCVDVRGVSKDDGAVAHQWECLGAGQPNQLWSFRPMRDGYYQIVAAHSRKCLDVSEVSHNNGAVVHQWECMGTEQTNQLWTLRTVGNYYQIIAKHTDKCLDVDISKAPYDNETLVQQWDCLGAGQANQLWKLQAVQRTYVVVEPSRRSGQYLVVPKK